MANYKKYAENLIGNWEKDIYAPQKDVTQAIYQTNWNKLTNDYNAVKDKLARNFALARNEYSNTLNDVQNASFNRMNNANIDLANRGLSGSGMLDLVTQGDTQVKGEAVDKALGNLLAANNASIEGLSEGVMGLGKGQTNLASDLSGDIGQLTDADAANNQQYAGLVSGIAQSAAGRAASRARSGGGSSKKTKKEQENDELERKMLIADTLASTELTDNQKKNYLNSYLGVPTQAAIDAVDAYNNNAKLNELNPKISALENKLANIQDYRQARRDSSNSLLNKIITNYNIFSIPGAMEYNTQQRLNELRNQTKGLSYSDLYDILYGKK